MVKMGFEGTQHPIQQKKDIRNRVHQVLQGPRTYNNNNNNKPKFYKDL